MICIPVYELINASNTADESPYTLKKRIVRSVWVQERRNTGDTRDIVPVEGSYCGIWNNNPCIVKINVSQNIASRNTLTIQYIYIYLYCIVKTHEG